MNDITHEQDVVALYDLHPINERQILDKLASDGIDLTGLTEDTLQHYDMDHYGGVEAIDVLARNAGIDETTRVLDVASGMGGPARYLAHHYGCTVTGIDLTESRVAGAKRLTDLVGLSDKVEFCQANALANPFPDQTFDVVIGQEAWCHIPDKPRLIGECVRVTKIGGRLSFTDMLERRIADADDRARLYRGLALADLETMSGYSDLLTDAGCRIHSVEDLSESWTNILRERLAMYRSLQDQTVSQFGAERFRQWDDTYALFVGLYETEELGGGRFLAERLR